MYCHEHTRVLCKLLTALGLLVFIPLGSVQAAKLKVTQAVWSKKAQSLTVKVKFPKATAAVAVQVYDSAPGGRYRSAITGAYRAHRRMQRMPFC